ncbi:isocitrate lyase/phosphoenolpyruvate mutase family protein [Bacillus carboniphilus]|uniref:Isocitrate lyase/phosphoenolpyruvate mutase family protein n=1 Tax=Bacillus carboniphilus TaxID=86663 RepID=A0ABY9JX73_9BACI|nr:isocitrate lyase/phosphoenolpyruvate mutase family protein [Bacillus carboniphilus]WLR42271.1 isocitrate lyase/phosphoenolpyruvate mutase family protein [Bacillus carboniphilus]
MDTSQKVKVFRELHNKSRPLVLLNIWSVESAKALTSHTIKLVATGSYAMAVHYGYEDGENMPFEEIITYINQMQPNENFITVDIESGYASNLYELEKNIVKLIEIGVVGLNIEDKVSGESTLYNVQDQCEKIAHIREVCKKLNSDIFINLRTDKYFMGDSSKNNLSEECLKQTLIRIMAYEEAGADCIFIPGLNNKKHIFKLANSVNVPINVMLDINRDNIIDYLNLGIGRISFGPSLYFSYNNKGNKDMNHFYENVLNSLTSYQRNNQIELLMFK